MIPFQNTFIFSFSSVWVGFSDRFLFCSYHTRRNSSGNREVILQCLNVKTSLHISSDLQKQQTISVKDYNSIQPSLILVHSNQSIAGQREDPDIPACLLNGKDQTDLCSWTQKNGVKDREKKQQKLVPLHHPFNNSQDVLKRQLRGSWQPSCNVSSGE